jgi:hypothetical protein
MCRMMSTVHHTLNGMPAGVVEICGISEDIDVEAIKDEALIGGTAGGGEGVLFALGFMPLSISCGPHAKKTYHTVHAGYPQRMAGPLR